MTAELFADGRVQLHCGDCRTVIATLPENSVDAVVTDPPYSLVSIAKRFGKPGSAPCKVSEFYKENGESKGSSPYIRASAGFMGQAWDTGETAFDPAFWAQVLRVLKPGGHLLAMGGTRTFHRLACAIEDAGFEIRDMIAWLYGSGFPKSHDVAKGMDRMLGVEREKVRCDNPRNPKATGGGRDGMPGATRPWIEEAMKRGYHELDSDVPATWAARQWDGWGTALKPALEPICLARKPLDGTIAENVMWHGTGALNIDGCRVPSSAEDQEAQKRVAGFNQSYSNGEPSLSLCGGVDGSLHKRDRTEFDPSKGRWAANLIHDNSPEVLAAFPESGVSSGGRIGNAGGGNVANLPTGQFQAGDPGFGDSGSAARYFASFNGRDGEASAERRYADEGATNFAALPGARRDGVPPSRLFYTSKADADDRLGSKHPTVKPLDLIQYLIRLICPKNGVVLDCFAGTGTTGEAALREGFRAILIEREAQYCEDIRRRMKLAFAGPDERTHASIKARGLVESPGPLFDGWDEAAE